MSVLMRFWGVEVKAGETVDVDPRDIADYVHITQAPPLKQYPSKVALGPSPKAGERVAITLTTAPPAFSDSDEEKDEEQLKGKDGSAEEYSAVVAVLQGGEKDQARVQLVLERPFSLAHGGTGSVFLSGYKTMQEYPDGGEAKKAQKAAAVLAQLTAAQEEKKTAEREEAGEGSKGGVGAKGGEGAKAGSANAHHTSNHAGPPCSRPNTSQASAQPPTPIVPTTLATTPVPPKPVPNPPTPGATLAKAASALAKAAPAASPAKASTPAKAAKAGKAAGTPAKEGSTPA
ncbi:unnamed protein product [Closterium sp. NIES-64]|nr:unnamed protein product [Closterium sp. NIES-64]